MLEGLQWLGLQWDEGPDIGGDFGPYRPSERLHLYKKYGQELLDRERAYYCFCTPQELDVERKAAQAAGKPFKYSRRCLALSPPQVEARREAGEKAVIRFKIESKKMAFDDLVQGRIEQDAALMGDPVIFRASGMPLYGFATVIDEYTMQISHVLRSSEHINNTFPQLQLYEALGVEPPQFGHFGLLLNPDRSKISKRTGAVYIGEFQEMGYLVETLLNHLALSGWNPGTEDEIFSLDDLLRVFSLERCGKSNAIFDRPKLLWLNGYHIRHTPLEELTRRALPFMEQARLLEAEKMDAAARSRFQSLIGLAQERLKTLAELPELLRFFFQDPEPGVCIELLKTNKYAKRHTLQELRHALAGSLEILQRVDEKEWRAETLDKALNAQVVQLGWKRAELFMPIRIAVSGRKATPPLFETLQFIGRAGAIGRLKAVIANN